MTVPTAVVLGRMREVLYQGPNERRDTCMRCQHSTMTLQGQARDKAYRCRVLAGDVRGGGCCAVWAPVAGPVIVLRPVEYLQVAKEALPKIPAERKARPPAVKRKASGVGATGAGHPWRRA